MRLLMVVIAVAFTLPLDAVAKDKASRTKKREFIQAQGTLRTEAGTPLSKVVALVNDGRVVLGTAAGNPFSFGNRAAVISDANGKFSFRAHEGEELFLRVLANGYLEDVQQILVPSAAPFEVSVVVKAVPAKPVPERKQKSGFDRRQ